jgi:transcriptional regulator with XRE-family HTH domain
MTISERIRTIRELRGLKQSFIAQNMQVSQQAYSAFERRPSSHKVDTLQKFCSAVNVDMPFLLATEIPVTHDNLVFNDTNNYTWLIEEYKKLKNKIEVYEGLIIKKDELIKKDIMVLN